MTMQEFEHVAEVSPSTDGTGIIGVKWNTSLYGKLPCSLMYGDKLFTSDQLKQAYEAGRASMMAEFEQVGGLYQFGKLNSWWNYSPTYKPAEDFDTEPGQIVHSIRIYRLKGEK